MAADTKMEASGSIVAFEGHPDVVSTQLRLLPTSPQILILPAVQCYIANDDSEQAFEIRNYIRKVHDALATRHEAARCFLQGASTANKRLAFLNGGTPSAQALCIKAIMKHETGGDRIEAEAVFARLARDGLAGLEAKSRIHSRASSGGDSAMFDDDVHDPITRAMRAADALDRQTANLQPTDMLDLTMTTRPRSLSLPLYGYTDGFGDAAPFFLFGAHVENEDEAENDTPLAPGAPTFAVVDYNQPSKLKPQDSVDARPASPSGLGSSQSRSNLGVSHGMEALSPTSDIFNIRTSESFTGGEAAKLEWRNSGSSFKRTLPKVKSLDRIYPLTAKLRDLCIPGASAEMGAEFAVPRRSHSFMVADETPQTIRRLSYVDRRTLLSKTRRPTFMIDSIPLDRHTHQGQGAAARFHTHLAIDITAPEEVPFQPVLPLVEDLVVYFKDETPDVLLSSIIRAFKAGTYPVKKKEMASVWSNNAFATTASLYQPTTIDQGSDKRSQETCGLSMPRGDYDPFNHAQPQQPSTREQAIPTVKLVRPPTPAQTPPPQTANEDKFHDFEIASGQTAVAIQNSLRSILSVYFPPEADGYRQFQFSLLPEFDGLWQPVFRESETRSSQRENNRKVHHILAIGSQQGVDKMYSSGIIKQLETIGTKSSDRQGRSGRVDFRYLLANAMQAFTALPLTNQTSDNPFTNSYLLATLLIPHLETYLALHSEIRYLLLEYPPEHLPTVLALQKLIGVDLIKVAQIVDPSNKRRLPFTQIGGPSLGAKPDVKTPNLTPQSSKSDITVSNANFLLTSTATTKDVAKFVSTVWNIPTEACDAEPLPPKKEPSIKKPKPAPIDASFSQFTKYPRSSVSSQSGPSPTSAEDSSSPVSLTLSSRPQSLTDNIKTPKSDVAYSRVFSRRRLVRSDSASMTTFDHGSDDSELDLEERRLMPMFMKPMERNGNTRKALKFLGLA